MTAGAEPDDAGSTSPEVAAVDNAVTGAALSAAAPGSHAAAVALDWPIMVALVIAIIASLGWLVWKALSKRP